MSGDSARPLVVGDVLHGFCGGHFGRDHYDCCRVEALGPDWLVARSEDGEDRDAAVAFACGSSDLIALRAFRGQSEWCEADPCPAFGGIPKPPVVAGQVLTAADPEPSVGTLVTDACGARWGNVGDYWVPMDVKGGDWDPESWAKIAGNYGPVTVIRAPGVRQ